MANAWFKFYVDDFIGATWQWSTVEIGAYLLLLLEQYQTGGIKSDQKTLRKVTKLSQKKLEKVMKTVGKKFTEIDGYLVNEKMANIRDQGQKSYANRVAGAQKTNEKRHGNRTEKPDGNRGQKVEIQSGSGSGSTSLALFKNKKALKHPSQKTTVDDVLAQGPARFNDPKMVEALEDWNRTRSNGGAKIPICPVTLKNELYRLSGWSLKPEQEIEIVQTAAANGWKSLRNSFEEDRQGNFLNRTDKPKTFQAQGHQNTDAAVDKVTDAYQQILNSQKGATVDDRRRRIQ